MDHGIQRVAILAARSTIGQAVVEWLIRNNCRFALIGRHLEGVTQQVKESECEDH